MSETTRNTLNTLNAMTGLGGMARAGVTAAQRLAEANRAATAARVPAQRIEPVLGTPTGVGTTRYDIPSFKKGGLVTRPKRRK
jgi:hypothetical protein